MEPPASSGRLKEKKRKREEKEVDRAAKTDTNLGIPAAVATEVNQSHESRPPPSDEEVEEFFAILRRTRDAVKYYGSSGYSSPCGEISRGLVPLGATDLPVVNGSVCADTGVDFFWDPGHCKVSGNFCTNVEVVPERDKADIVIIGVKVKTGGVNLDLNIAPGEEATARPDSV